MQNSSSFVNNIVETTFNLPTVNTNEPNYCIFKALKWEYVDIDDCLNIFIHGLTENNDRVAVKISNFLPYIYLELDPSVNWSNKTNRTMLDNHFKRYLKNTEQYVKFKYYNNKTLAYYYKPANFFKLYFKTLTHLDNFCRYVMYGSGNKFTQSKALKIEGVGYGLKFKLHETKAARSPDLQLATVTRTDLAGWIKVPLNENCGDIEKFSTNAIEIDLDDYTKLKPVNSTKTVNPLIWSYDIECTSGDASGNTFTNAFNSTDEIICISVTVSRMNDAQTDWKTYCLVNGSNNKACPENIGDNSIIMNFKNEKRLLLGYKKFQDEIDPDIVITYNGLSFDDNYIKTRVKFLGIENRFYKHGRLLSVDAHSAKPIKWSSSAYKDQCFDFIDIPGRLHVDLFPFISKEFTTLPSYSLNAVAEYFLNRHKVDLPAKEMIQIHHRGRPEDIERICFYCNEDTRLPFELLKWLNAVIGLIETSNVVKIQIFDLLTRGQQMRVYGQIYYFCAINNIVVNNQWSDYAPTDGEKKFVGATVQTPMSGLHDNVGVFDFKSLYPTTIIAYNLCFSTFIPWSVKLNKEDEDKYWTFQWEDHYGCEHDHGIRKSKVSKDKVICAYAPGMKAHKYRFWKREFKQGIIPQILVNLLDARQNTRTELETFKKELKTRESIMSKKEIDAAKVYCSVLDKRQNGFKISANSMYGGFGSDYSETPFYPAAASTTFKGRENIQKAINIAKEFRPDAVVVYGDSVTPDTPILCKDDEDTIFYQTVDKIGDGNWKQSPHGDGKEICDAIDGYIVWTETGFTRIKKVIRHICKKPLKRIKTRTGVVDVTTDHSLLKPDGTRISPLDVHVGTQLMHVDLPETLYINREFHEVKSCTYKVTNKLEAANIFKNVSELGWYVYLQNVTKKAEYTIVVTTEPSTDPIDTVEQIIDLPAYNGYVYDLETENHHFSAGIGRMIVHNTDSAMIKFSAVKSLENTFEVCKALQNEYKKHFPFPMELDLEKIYKKFFLLSKKRYSGNIVDESGKLLSVDNKGLITKRRDNCDATRDIYKIIMDKIKEGEKKWQIYETLGRYLGDMIEGKIPYHKFVLTMSIRNDYINQNLPHVAVSKKMIARGKYVTAGTRINYLFIDTGNAKDPMYKKSEDPDYYLEMDGKIHIDYMEYLRKSIAPLDELIEVRFGQKNVLKVMMKLLKKGKITTPTEYFSPKFQIIT